ncbi:MBL fold metallo-hydrolase [Ramlibacter sp. XY19]|uniref:MBL fold metallo-hydrolase n=1 Tax=Ramlibacter paludis TaxID=2908000 RepID=UPI0023DAC303|nr:MBL fold metallo-hydrolase [Ramlibacter paludis]MCG2592519.1 MBL fold metallo-hydrolase [Ramlibacter paludis]
MQAQVQAFFDPVTGTVSYVVHAGAGSACAIVDPVLDFDARSGRTSTASAERIVDFVADRRLQVEWILETHAHADHLSAAAWLRGRLGGKIAVGGRITEVQGVFKKLFHLEPGFAADGHQFDHLFTDGETFAIGALQARVIAMPGHTPACVAYQVGDSVFVGDTLFMPDVGTARCDFPGGSAAQLYGSIRRLLALPPSTRLYMCHDYPPEGREPQWETTVAAQRASNIHVHDGIGEEAFVAMRQARDATLGMPTLILPSVQVNIRAGQMPPPEDNGVSYLKIPLNTL